MAIRLLKILILLLAFSSPIIAKVTENETEDNLVYGEYKGGILMQMSYFKTYISKKEKVRINNTNFYKFTKNDKSFITTPYKVVARDMAKGGSRVKLAIIKELGTDKNYFFNFCIEAGKSWNYPDPSFPLLVTLFPQGETIELAPVKENFRWINTKSSGLTLVLRKTTTKGDEVISKKESRTTDGGGSYHFAGYKASETDIDKLLNAKKVKIRLTGSKAILVRSTKKDFYFTRGKKVYYSKKLSKKFKPLLRKVRYAELQE